MMVYLVGAGPGDPGLLTIKGMECIKKAAVLVYDRLVSPDLLKYAPEDCELIYVGKSPDRHTLRQEEINQLLVDKAREKGIVTRLKGGDPFVFGRGGEEAETLRKNGIAFEVVPGISSSIAAPAYAGIPVTHRHVATSFAVITGHEDPTKGESSINWEHLAQGVDTLIFLMGVSTLANTVANLLKYGRKATTPVALVRWGTTKNQKTLVGTLENIVELVQQNGFTSPAVTIVGEVVNLRETLKWFENQPLFGKRIVVTRARAQASDLSNTLKELGAQVIEFPAIEIQPLPNYQQLDEAIRQIESYDWVIFTSVNGVDYFTDRLLTQDRDWRDLKGSKICAIGPQTAACLSSLGLQVDFVPPEYRAEGIIEGLKEREIAGKKVLLARASVARDILPQELEKLGAQVTVAPTYQTVVPEPTEEEIKVLGQKVDLITFTSSSTVKNFKTLWQQEKKAFTEAQIAAIGPITANTAKEEGFTVDIEAKEYTIKGLVQAILDYYQEQN